ncbi:MAG: oxygen-binding heme protein [Nocardioidaceae bacterium]|nr:oxygen-binding heme protein [Nocardioidaceae bacterium]
MTSLYEFAGGGSAFLALSRAMHVRCLADPELNHPFSKEDQHPQHDERLAAYWAEVLGGPPSYSSSMGDQSELLVMHAGNGDMSDLGRRFVDCFVLAMDDAGLPDDPTFRASMRAYMEAAVGVVLEHGGPKEDVPRGLAMPRWGWEGWSLADANDDGPARNEHGPSSARRHRNGRGRP